MNIKRAKQEIEDTVKAYLLKDQFGNYMIPSIRQRPVLLMGPPGVGKTQIMEQIARDLGIGLVSYTITHHTRQSAVGLPFIKEKTYDGVTYSVTEYTMSEIIAAIYEKMEKTGIREGILFIDEINCVSETMAPMMLQFLQCKTFGNQKVPEGWIIVSAGNPPEYNKSVRDFDVVTLDRVKRLSVEADFEVWKEYAYKEQLHGAVISYLEIRKNHFYQVETTVDGMIFATARGWEDLSQLIGVYEKLGKTVDAQVVGQYIQHPRIARDFANYLELYYKYHRDYRIDEVLKGNLSTEAISKLHFAEFDERLSVMGLILDRLGEAFYLAMLQDVVTTQLFENLKKVRAAVEQDGEGVLSGTLAALLEEVRGQYEHEKEAGLLDKRSNEAALCLLEKLEAFGKAESFEAVRMLFAGETDAREQKMDAAGEMLEYAFDFMEAAFGEGQELVVFVTELTAGYYSAWFIKENGCDRYYKYNKGLLFADRQRAILEQIDAAKDQMIGADLKG